MHTMITFTHLLALLIPLPATKAPVKRRRAIRDLHLSRHLLSDVGMEDHENPADDPRWSLKPHLER